MTEPLFTDTAWLPVWGDAPSYEEYFSEKHAYPYGDCLNLLSHSWGIREDGTLAADNSEADRQYRLTLGGGWPVCPDQQKRYLYDRMVRTGKRRSGRL